MNSTNTDFSEFIHNEFVFPTPRSNITFGGTNQLYTSLKLRALNTISTVTNSSLVRVTRVPLLFLKYISSNFLKINKNNSTSSNSVNTDLTYLLYFDEMASAILFIILCNVESGIEHACNSNAKITTLFCGFFCEQQFVTLFCRPGGFNSGGDYRIITDAFEFEPYLTDDNTSYFPYPLTKMENRSGQVKAEVVHIDMFLFYGLITVDKFNKYYTEDSKKFKNMIRKKYIDENYVNFKNLRSFFELIFDRVESLYSLTKCLQTVNISY